MQAAKSLVYEALATAAD